MLTCVCLLTGASNLKELNLVLSHLLMVRRLKRDVLKQLPSKRRQQVLAVNKSALTAPQVSLNSASMVPSKERLTGVGSDSAALLS